MELSKYYKIKERKKDDELYSDNFSKSYSEWKLSNGQEYLEIYAPDYYTLGYLQGRELENEIEMMKSLLKLLTIKYILKRFSYSKLREMARRYERYIPKHCQIEMKGMADAVDDVDYDDILLQNCFMDIMYGDLIPNNYVDGDFQDFDLGCTSLGIKRKNNPLIGQNFDYPFFFRSAASFVHLISPNNSEIFSLRLGGMLSLPVGINSSGLSLRINVIKSNLPANPSMPATIKSRIGLEFSRNSVDFYSFLINQKNSASCNLMIADKSYLYALECLPKFFVKKEIKNYVVNSNTYTSLEFQTYLINKDYSKERQDYTENRLKEMYEIKGDYINDDDMLEILKDFPIICRNNPFKPMTLAFLTNKYFGLGGPDDHEPGLVPLNIS
ncbi:MAG: hypothetical protein EU550_01305 [Promethearchaeota archaeon]|nr:MAG: hypothetical protein EU550_01305 [Candidatus Lokiarchaeota archaeon]